MADLSSTAVALSLSGSVSDLFMKCVFFFLSSGWGTEASRRLILLFKRLSGVNAVKSNRLERYDGRCETGNSQAVVVSDFTPSYSRERAINILRRQHNCFLLM